MSASRRACVAAENGWLEPAQTLNSGMATMKHPNPILLCAALLLVAGGQSVVFGAAAADPRRPVKRSAGQKPASAQVQQPKAQPLDPQIQRSKAPPQIDHRQAARVAVAKGDLALATREARLAVQENPLDAEAHFLLGCLLQRQGESDQAAVGFQRALAIDPVKPEAQYNLGTMLIARGDAVRATGLLESAVLTRPDHVPTYNNLAKAYFLAGLPELAIATYEEALRRDPANPVALKNMQILIEGLGDPNATAIYRQRIESLRQGRAPALPAATPAFVHDAALAQNPTVVVGESLVPPPERAPVGDPEVDALRDILRDLPNVNVERRGGRVTLTGWTNGPKEREILDKVIGKPPAVQKMHWSAQQSPVPYEETPGARVDDTMQPRPGAPREAFQPPAILDLTTDDSGDPHRMIEIDAVLFILRDLTQRNVGFNFLRAVDLSLNYTTSGLDSQSDLSGHSDLSGFNTRGAPISTIGQPSANGSASWSTTGPIDDLVANTLTRTISQLSQEGWVFGAGIDYVVNIANAVDERVAILARPHLTALSGTPATFLAGGELVFRVSGLNSGDIKPYPFGTTLTVTPTLLRTAAPDGTPRVHLNVEAGRTSVLSLLEQESDEQTTFEKLTVTSEAVLNIGQTLILSGLNQRESRSGRNGVPVLRDIPLVKYLFSSKSTIENDVAVIILLTPRDPAFWDKEYLRSAKEFLDMRRAFVRAKMGTDEDMRRFSERYPNWQQIPPSRFASHFILAQNSELYRSVSGQSLSSEDIDLELLGPAAKNR